MATESQHYEQLGRILQEAGFLFVIRAERCELSGNKIVVANSNLVAKNCEGDEIEAKGEDVMIMSGDQRLEVATIDAGQGIITLKDSLEQSEEVEAFYQYSTIELDYLKVVREDVEGLINARLHTIKQCSRMKNNETTNKLRIITRLWAGGLLLSREYGYNTDSEQTSKDGYRKIQEAKTMLDELYDDLMLECGQDDINGGSSSVISDSDGSLFEEPHGTAPWNRI